MAGDPKQLGPVLRSAHAKSKGLDVSLLERLMGMDLYSPSTTSGAYNNKYITKLVNNFRSNLGVDPLLLRSPILYVFLVPFREDTHKKVGFLVVGPLRV